MSNDNHDLEKGEYVNEGVNGNAVEQHLAVSSDGDSHHSRNASSIDKIEETPLEDDEEEPQNLEHAKSKTSSTKSRTIIKVPRSKRRGLFARFCLTAEVEDPYLLHRGSKWLITLVVALAAVAAPMGSSIFYPSLAEISRDFNSTSTIANLSVAFYMLSMGIFPLWW